MNAPTAQQRQSARLLTPPAAHVVHVSGGITSWAAGQRVVDAGHRPVLLFADTLVEDADTYRFLIQSSALTMGVGQAGVADVAGRALRLTTLGPGTDDERDAMLARRRAELAALRDEAMSRIPGFAWIADGRSPWEVFRDERYIGNSRVDPCSKILKRKLLDRWCEAHAAPDAIHYLGLDWTEPKRIDRFRAAFAPSRVAFPLAEPPHLLKRELVVEVELRGVMASRAYGEGYPHDNCGGFCVKAGHRGARRLMDTRRDYYLYNEQEEARWRRLVGKDNSVLRDRRGGAAVAITLAQYRERVRADGDCDLMDLGGCNCFEVEEEVVHVA